MPRSADHLPMSPTSPATKKAPGHLAKLEKEPEEPRITSTTPESPPLLHFDFEVRKYPAISPLFKQEFEPHFSIPCTHRITTHRRTRP